MALLWERKKIDPLEAAADEPFVDDEVEARESLAFKKGLIAFDIIFDKRGNPFVLEIQSTDAGLRGIVDGLADDTRVPNDIKEMARKVAKRQSGYTNPSWYHELGGRKDQQLAFIPDEYRPRSVVNGDFTQLFQYGKVIVKPVNESQGYGIRIFDNSHKKEAAAYAAKVKDNYGGFVAQSLIESKGADEAPEELRAHAASLRLIILFEVVDGKIKINFDNLGYQRVAPEPMPESVSDATEYDKAGVVNLSRRARPVPMSSAEYKRALPVVHGVIQNLLTKAEASSDYRKQLRWKLETKASDMDRKFSEAFPRFNLYMHGVQRDETLKGARDAIRFIRFVERSLTLLQPGVKEKLEKKLAYIYFAYRGGSDGVLSINIGGVFKTIDEKIPFTTNEKPLVLTRLIEDAAAGRTLKK